MKLVLTSNFPMKKNELVADRIRSLVDNDVKILYIAYNDSVEKYCRLVEEYGFAVLDYINLTKGFSIESLNECNCILLHGGNPFIIKSTLRETGFLNYLEDTAQVIITVSGSTCVMAKEFSLLTSFYPNWEGENTKGFGFFNYEVLPHFHRYKKHMSKIKEYSAEKPVYAIPDRSAIVCNNGNVELIGKSELLE